METGKIVKIVIVIVGFGAAGIIFAMTRGGDQHAEVRPDDVKMVDLVCVDSGEHIQRPFDEIRAYGLRPRGGQGRATRDKKPASSVVVYPVSECGQGGAVLADYCEQCDKWYPKFKPDGTPGTCPVCGGR